MILVMIDTSIFGLPNHLFDLFFGRPFRNQTDDYSAHWFESNGNLLIHIMILFAIYPLIEATLIVPFYYLLRWMDKNLHRLRDGTLTAMPSIDAYIELHAGPAFLMHYRMVSMLLQITIALLYGVALPILYPIALIGLVIQSVIDRLLLCYFYREPPHYDEKSTLQVIKIIEFVAISSLFHHFWILSNRQIFEGYSQEIEFANDVQMSHHSML